MRQKGVTDSNAPRLTLRAPVETSPRLPERVSVVPDVTGRR
jgi:hypothetical protein